MTKLLGEGKHEDGACVRVRAEGGEGEGGT